MKLYFSWHSRAVGVRWLLEELSVNYEIEWVDLTKAQQRSENFLRINPHGHVPVLVDRGQILLESVAILAYLADSFIEKGLAPPTGSAQRGLYYQWLFYSTATLERHVKQLVLQTIKLPAGERSESAASTSRKELECCAQYLESCLKDRPFIMGVQFSAADIALSHWMKTMRDELGLLGQCPHALAYLDSILSRPALLRASMP